MDLLQNCGPFKQNLLLVKSLLFKQNSGPFNFNKLMDLLFRKGVLQHLENSPGYRPKLSEFLIDYFIIVC